MQTESVSSDNLIACYVHVYNRTIMNSFTTCAHFSCCELDMLFLSSLHCATVQCRDSAAVVRVSHLNMSRELLSMLSPSTCTYRTETRLMY